MEAELNSKWKAKIAYRAPWGWDEIYYRQHTLSSYKVLFTYIPTVAHLHTYTYTKHISVLKSTHGSGRARIFFSPPNSLAQIWILFATSVSILFRDGDRSHLLHPHSAISLPHRHSHFSLFNDEAAYALLAARRQCSYCHCQLEVRNKSEGFEPKISAKIR